MWYVNMEKLLKKMQKSMKYAGFGKNQACKKLKNFLKKVLTKKNQCDKIIITLLRRQ